MAINLKAKIGKNKVVILVIPDEEYAEFMIKVSKSVASDYKKICYVNLNKSYFTLTNAFKSENINLNKFFFIDGVTKKAGEAKKAGNCLYVDAPNALTQLSLGINKIFKTFKPEILLFDSLSTILIYEEVNTVLKFVHSLIGKIRLVDCVAVFTVLEGDVSSNLIKDLSMFIDKLMRAKERQNS